MRLSLVPQQKIFFELLEAEAKNVLVGVERLKEMLENYDNLEERRCQIKNIEHQGDEIVHEIFDHLNKSFITPIDREDISSIASSLDTILDYTEGISNRLVIYRVENIPDYLLKLTIILLKSTQEVNKVVKKIRNLKDRKAIRECTIKINEHENEGDEISLKAIALLFENEDAKEIIKMQDIIKRLETSIDKCEDIAIVIENLLVKYG